VTKPPREFLDAGGGAPADEPTVTCRLCGRWLIVVPDGRGFPPGIAKRKLARTCSANGCASDPVYRAGVAIRSRPDGQEQA
jgi:hypothetical protein